MCELNKVEAMELIKGIIGSKVCAMYYNKKKGMVTTTVKFGNGFSTQKIMIGKDVALILTSHMSANEPKVLLK